MAAETNITALKEALCAQQRLLQKLYNELDVEREASATAASETLSMILRLQGEKSAVKMEAEHYKRLAEEKMRHADESMEIFEDVLYQKEMEIASLDYQLQAYKYKLSSLGYKDVGVTEIKFPESLLQRSETLVGETNTKSLTRGNSAPPKLLKLAYLKKGILERERSISPDSDMILKIVEESAPEDESHRNTDSENKADGFNSYWDQIRKLDKIVEEMAAEQYSSLRTISSRSSSVVSQQFDRGHSPRRSMDAEILSNTCSTSVHDVFEVPQVDESIVSCEKQAKDEGKMIFKGEKVRNIVTFPKEAINPYVKEEFGEKTLLLRHKDKKVFLPRDAIAIDCAKVQGSTQQSNTTTEITEAAMQDEIQEQVTTTGREEELNLLYEIREKVNSIQSEIRSRNTKTKKSSTNSDVAMLQLTEAMLHFWL